MKNKDEISPKLNSQNEVNRTFNGVRNNGNGFGTLSLNSIKRDTEGNWKDSLTELFNNFLSGLDSKIDSFFEKLKNENKVFNAQKNQPL